MEYGNNLLIRLGRIRKDGVAAHVGARKDTQHDVSRRLTLVAYVLMPQGGCRLDFEEVGHFVLVVVTMDDVKSWMAADGTSDGLVVELAKVFPRTHCQLL